MFTSILIVFMVVSFTGCDSGNSTSSSSTYDRPSSKVDHSRTEYEIKEDLGTRERSNPRKHLSASGTYRKNLWGEFVLEGKISNAATIATFKDVDLHITGYSKTNSEVGTWKETVYEYVKPGRSKSFKIKIMLPKEVKSVNYQVNNAVAVN